MLFVFINIPGCTFIFDDTVVRISVILPKAGTSLEGFE
jgi:hypothetical protein